MPHSTSHTSEAFSSRLSEPFQIGRVRLPNRLVLAPMAGITGRALRLQARRFGAGLVGTELISSFGVHYGSRRTLQMMEITGAEHPASVQLFGNDPQVMAEAAVAAQAAGADIIDINMGCSVRKVVKTGAGVALMRDEGLAAEIVAAMAAAVRVPVTAKMRAGFSDVTAPSLALRLQEAGAAAIAIHPRTGAQGWKGSADHRVTASLAAELDIPVMASGDIGGMKQAWELLDEAGASAVMLGRAALGNPWLFADLLAGREPRRRGLGEVLMEMSRFYADIVAEMGEDRAVRHMRKFYGWYLRPFGLPADLRLALRQAGSFSEALELVRASLSLKKD